MKHLKNPLVWIPALILTVILTMTLWVYMSTTLSWGVNLNKKNELGDAIGGTTAPFIGILVAILTYLAFRSQIDFNKQQLKYVKDQIIENKITSLNHSFDIVATAYRNREPVNMKTENLKKVTEILQKTPIKNIDGIGVFMSQTVTKLGLNTQDTSDIRFVHNHSYALVALLLSFEMDELKDELFKERRVLIMHNYFSKSILLLDPKFHDLFRTYLALMLKLYNIDTTRIILKDYNDFNHIEEIKKALI